MTGDREKALQSGCDEYLSKSLDEDLLFATLARFLVPVDRPQASAGCVGDGRT
jgi:CheY-like chemotaxis protein